MAHCTLLQGGELQAIVGDASRNGVGGQQYCGLWSLTSKHRPFNAFGNSYAGLIPGELRGHAPWLEVVDDNTAIVMRRADAFYPVEARAVYRVVPPWYIDHTLTFIDRQPMVPPDCSFREVSWCSYMNCPEDSRIHFLANGEWFRYVSPEHGAGSNIGPGYVPDSELEVWPQRQQRPFHWDRIARRFDQPFYYGRLGGMVLIFIFDRPRWLRFFCSPSGGGESLLPGRTCPAWDFEWVIPRRAYQPGREYRFRVRMVYKRFVSDEDVLEEYRSAQQALGFEAPPGGDANE